MTGHCGIDLHARGSKGEVFDTIGQGGEIVIADLAGVIGRHGRAIDAASHRLFDVISAQARQVGTNHTLEILTMTGATAVIGVNGHGLRGKLHGSANATGFTTAGFAALFHHAAERLDIRNKGLNLIVAEIVAIVLGHDVVVALDHFGAWINDGLVQVVVIDCHRAAVTQFDLLAVDIVQRRGRGRILIGMTARATQIRGHEQAFTFGHQTASGHFTTLARLGRGLATEPGVIISLLHGDDLASHLGVAGAAVLGGVERIFPRPGGGKPHGGELARQNILLLHKIGDEEAVGGVLRRHDQPHRLANHHMQLIDLALAIGRMLELPHPVLGHRNDILRIVGHLDAVQIDER